ncbi:MAG: F0F1 ATP synthase subunit epsilon [Oscillospiraceae bacterium]|nr:F0F1 ATP synthase subunit epsilon [Oscillospiraceae bacterium]
MKMLRLQILTPEREFFHGDVEAVTVASSDGFVTVLAGHTPLITPVSVGTIRIKNDGVWKDAINSEGFMEVNHHGATIFVQTCRKPP